MKNVAIKIKENLIYILIPVIFISFLLINSNVVYFGDDYYYLSFQNLEFSDFFIKLVEHYQKDNGRFIVHLLATLFLKMPIQFWQILNSFMLTGICYFGAKVVTQNKKQNLPLIITIFFFFISILSITVTRQSTYWLTGSFNYIYPLLLLFAYWFCLCKINNKKFFILSIILGFLSAATMEQSGMMTFGLTILTLLSKLDHIKNLKNVLIQNKKLLILSLITLVGLCTVILAPAQFVRIQKSNNGQSTLDIILTNISFIAKNYTSQKKILPYCILFNLAALNFIKRSSNIKWKKIIIITSILNIFLNIINIFSYANSHIFTPVNVILALGILLTYTITFLYINKHLYKKIISPLTISAILMLGSQIMVTITPVFGYRNLIFGLLMFATIICLIINSLDIKYNNIFTGLFLVLALYLNLKTTNGYIETKKIENKNIEIIKSNSQLIKDSEKEITLYKFPNDNFAWSMPYISTYHEHWFKQFYQIQCKINWETNS